VTKTNKDFSSSTDEELMQAYQQGIENAFDEIYKRYSSRIYGFLRRRLHRKELVDEAFQGAFMKLHTSRDSYKSTYPFAPWLFTVCRTAMIDVLRNQEVVHLQPDINFTPQTLLPVSAPNLDSLPLNQKRAIELRYFEDLEFEQIATRIGTTPQGARQLVSRGVRNLKNVLSLKDKK
jgi:DNA-directed RNA polymerase specialized sigma24 family protein